MPRCQEKLQKYSDGNKLVDGLGTTNVSVSIGVKIDGLTPGTIYSFELKAISAEGRGNNFGNVLAVSTMVKAKATTKKQ